MRWRPTTRTAACTGPPAATPGNKLRQPPVNSDDGSDDDDDDVDNRTALGSLTSMTSASNVPMCKRKLRPECPVTLSPSWRGRRLQRPRTKSYRKNQTKAMQSSSSSSSTVQVRRLLQATGHSAEGSRNRQRDLEGPPALERVRSRLAKSVICVPVNCHSHSWGSIPVEPGLRLTHQAFGSINERRTICSLAGGSCKMG